MKIILILAGCILLFAGFRWYVSANAKPVKKIRTTDFYELTYTDIDGNEVSMESYKGKYVLCVNVASQCGNTPQYEGLQKLHESQKDKLVIIGFPCNQFLGQEPGDEKQIRKFCTENYGVTFLLASKLDVKGSNQHPVFQWLTSESLNGVSDAKVEWNFHKFLVSPEGKWLHSFSASSDPMGEELVGMLK